MLCSSARTNAEDKAQGGNSAESAAGKTGKRYLQCPGALTIRMLKKFLRQKYGLKFDNRVDIYYLNNLVPESFSLIDVAYTYSWDRKEPMKFGYQILERHAVKVTKTNRVVLGESSSSSSLEMTVSSVATTEVDETDNQLAEQVRELGLTKRKLKENTSSVLLEDGPAPSKKPLSKQSEMERRRWIGRDEPLLSDKTQNYQEVENPTPNKLLNCGQESIESENVEEEYPELNTREDKGEQSQATSPGRTEDSAVDLIADDDEVMETEEVSQTADSIEGDALVADANQDIEEVIVDVEGEPSQDFILQEEQPMDISEDLEEDDDEDRLRICDPEEVPEEKNGDENAEEGMEVDSVQPQVEEEKLENVIEEETEVVRKESKSRKKNKKAKHHHRHKRDYSPAPEATIVSDDNVDVLKLKLKITRSESESSQGKLKNKQDDNSKYHSLSDNHNSPKQIKHHRYSIAEETEPSCAQSPSNSNIDEDSRNSQSTDDHDVRSVASSKEGQDDLSQVDKDTQLHNGNLDSSKAKKAQLTNKEKLLQMRQVRHKNITPPPPPRISVNTTISKVSAEEASKNSPKTPILLTSPTSSLTVSKVTAEEKMMMMNNNNLESKKPSLEIIMVNKPNNVNKNSDIKLHNNQPKQKHVPVGIPVVKLMKSNSLNAMLPKQNALTVSKVKTEGANKSTESAKSGKDNKVGDRKVGEKKGESFGALDLSGKSNRSCGSSPASENSNCPSPNQTALSMTQPLINRHLAATGSPRRSPGSPPVPTPAAVPKGSPTRALQQHTSGMWNLMTLTNTAVSVSNKNMQEDMKRQLANNQKLSPQRYPSVSSPTQLKIPTPSTSFANKFIGRHKAPTAPGAVRSSTSKLSGSMTRPASPASRGRSVAYPIMYQSQSVTVAKKQAGINGRIPPPPPAIPISTLYKMENMARKYDLEKIARGISAASKAAAGIPSS
ncbi:histone H2A-K119 monoubiquitination [Homalodisca vitripennis]|nr:histone H2A-K119 monoubiquitination [Homalodisca vitripennis]